jgi:hypothetical protein
MLNAQLQRSLRAPGSVVFIVAAGCALVFIAGISSPSNMYLTSSAAKVRRWEMFDVDFLPLASERRIWSSRSWLEGLDDVTLRRFGEVGDDRKCPEGCGIFSMKAWCPPLPCMIALDFTPAKPDQSIHPSPCSSNALLCNRQTSRSLPRTSRLLSYLNMLPLPLDYLH